MTGAAPMALHTLGRLHEAIASAGNLVDAVSARTDREHGDAVLGVLTDQLSARLADAAELLEAVTTWTREACSRPEPEPMPMLPGSIVDPQRDVITQALGRRETFGAEAPT